MGPAGLRVGQGGQHGWIGGRFWWILPLRPATPPWGGIFGATFFGATLRSGVLLAA